MRRIRLALEELREGHVVLAEDRSRYLRHVLRVKAGVEFEVFDPRTGDTATAVIADAHSILVSGKRSSTSIFPIHWVQGLAKGDKNDRIVQDATELGAETLTFVPTVRSIVKIAPDKIDERVRRFQKIADSAASQSGRTLSPRVGFRSWESLLSELRSSPETSTICFYEGGGAPLYDLLPAPPLATPLRFFVGPEGGIDPKEIEAMTDAGAQLATLGPRILRTETVVAAVLGSVNTLYSR